MPRSKSVALYRSQRRWTEEDARAALMALAASGLSVREFAKQEALDAQRLYYWQGRLGPAEVPEFLEVRPSPDNDDLEVVLLSGRILRFAQSTDMGVLRRVVETLEDFEC